ncbi:DUF2808 domain-containing protein [Microcoleus sp. ZQ-A2]|nr:DUF2808 domain-containing protein [Microcoleus sp. FACHB-1]
MFKISNQFSIACLKALGFNTLMLGALLSGFLLSMSKPAASQNLGNRQVNFNSSPHLIRAAVATYPGVGALAQYQFTVRVPDKAGKPVQAVKITQRENLERIRFAHSHSAAFAGDRFAGGSEVSIASVAGSESSDSNEVTVVFEQPVPPGTTVTISLRGTRPTWGGIYLFGITAFPIGENTQGSYLGSGRIAFP